jgi:hypothetical protein
LIIVPSIFRLDIDKVENWMEVIYGVMCVMLYMSKKARRALFYVFPLVRMWYDAKVLPF